MTDDKTVLSELNPGEKARVCFLDDSLDKQKLSAIGIIEDTEIEVLYRSPFGNPAAYLIRGAVFALRKDTAEKIAVEKIESI